MSAAKIKSVATIDTKVVAWIANKTIERIPLIAKAGRTTDLLSGSISDDSIAKFFHADLRTVSEINTKAENPRIPSVPRICRNSLYAVSKEKFQNFCRLNSAGL